LTANSLIHRSGATNNQALQVKMRIADTAYEKNRLDYLGIRAAIVSAKNEGLAEGKAEGKIELLKRQLIRRFSSLPDWAITKIESANVAQLEAWAEAIFDAQSIEQLLSDCNYLPPSPAFLGENKS